MDVVDRSSERLFPHRGAQVKIWRRALDEVEIDQAGVDRANQEDIVGVVAGDIGCGRHLRLGHEEAAVEAGVRSEGDAARAAAPDPELRVVLRILGEDGDVPASVTGDVAPGQLGVQVARVEPQEQARHQRCGVWARVHACVVRPAGWATIAAFASIVWIAGRTAIKPPAISPFIAVLVRRERARASPKRSARRRARTDSTDAIRTPVRAVLVLEARDVVGPRDAAEQAKQKTNSQYNHRSIGVFHVPSVRGRMIRFE